MLKDLGADVGMRPTCADESERRDADGSRQGQQSGGRPAGRRLTSKTEARRAQGSWSFSSESMLVLVVREGSRCRGEFPEG